MSPPLFSVSPPGRRAARVARAIGTDLRSTLTTTDLAPDLKSGAAVALSALPITLGVALASDVPPGPALAAAVAGGLVAATLGVVPLVVTAPAAALAVLTGSIVDRHGLPGIALVAVVAGLTQLALALGALSRIARLVPQSVLRGFDAGLGMLLLVGQLPRLLGLAAPDESHVFDVLGHVGSYAHDASPLALGVAAFALLATYYLPRAFPWAPGAFLAVGLPTLVLALAQARGATVSGLPTLSYAPWEPRLGFEGVASDLPTLLADALLVAAVCSVQSLRTLGLVHAARTEIDLDRELASQGLANLAAGLVGGIPVSAVPKRSRLAVDAGGRTRRVGWIASILLFALAALAAPLATSIPIAALAGVVAALALRLVRPREIVQILRADRAEGVVLLLTAGSMVLFDFEAGIQAGVVAALALGLVRGSRSRILVEAGRSGAPHHLELGGPLTFVHVASLDRLESQLDALPHDVGLVVDLRHVEQIDHTAASHLARLVSAQRERGMRVALHGPRADVAKALASAGTELEPLIAMSEKDLDRILSRSRTQHAAQRIARGVSRFRAEVRDQLSPLLSELSVGQEPHTLFLTCADSRVAPSLITAAQPGEIFVVRNIGALVPPASVEERNDEGAALEYAIKVLGVRQVIVCGHAKCGAMKALCAGAIPEDLPTLGRWAESAREIVPELTSFEEVDDATKATTQRQLENLRSYAFVADAVARGELRLTGWFYDLDRAEVLELREDLGRFVEVGSEEGA